VPPNPGPSASVSCASPDGRRRRKVCANSPAGFAELAAWLRRPDVARVQACLEATGTYGEALATMLYDAGHRVSVCIHVAFGVLKSGRPYDASLLQA
jgi:transposase